MCRKLTNLVKVISCVLFLLVATQQEVSASHAMGADLTYECLGGNQYRLTFSFYRDCAGIAAPSSVSIQYSSSCFPAVQSVTLNPTATSPTLITPVCPTVATTCNGGTFTGIQEWIYTGVVTLPGPCADWIFSQSQCCRNNAISTISSPGSQDLYVYTLMNNTNGICNNSPTFSNRPVPFACVGQRFCFNHGANDIDGDSITYQLITPLDGPGVPVTYLAPYSNTQPVQSSPPVTFNPLTGDICMLPTQADVTVFAVLVSEYRNGVLIGQIERDIQLTVNACNNQLPWLTGINGTPFSSATICANVPYSFYIASIDLDAANTTTITWDFGIPGATLTMTGGRRDSAFFNWTPTTADISNIPYCFTATVYDDNCPYLGLQIFSYCFTVRGVEANAGPDQTVSCGATTTLVGSGSGSPGAYNYVWNPGNVPGTTLNGAGVGTYTFTVSLGACSHTDTVQVLPGAGVPTADFAFTNNCSGLPINFTDQSVVAPGVITGWNWNFGDGSPTSNLQNPSHLYGANGTYNVTLIVFTATGCSDTLTQQVVINTNIPTASFTAANVCQGTPVNFTDQSGGGPITNWSWNFNDPASGGANSSSAQNPTHAFTGPGTYNVTLQVTNAAGCTNQIQQNVTVHANPVFNVVDEQICVGGQITLSGPAGYSLYSWAPGGAGQSITVSPASTTVYVLTVTDANTCVGSDNVTVTVNALPVANAGADQTICQGTNANLSASGGATYVWNPGNLAGQNVTVSPSNTTVFVVTVTNAAGCTNTAQMTVNVNPMPSVSAGNDAAICKGGSITLTANSGVANYVWTPGGMGTSSITVSPAITTTYTVTVSDAIGCAGTDQVTVTVNPLPVADFTNTGPACLGSAVTLNDASTVTTGSVTGWNWDLGNSQNSFTQHPSVTYSSDGTFTVTLIVVTNAGCRDTTTDVVRINPNPVAQAGPDAAICPGVNATLIGSGGASYLWNPGGFTTASITVSPGSTTNYSLLVTDANGCQNTDQASVIVHPVPVANAGSDQAVCFGSGTTLFASGGDTYLWNPGNVNSANLNVIPTATTTYTVLVTNAFGCQDVDQVTVNVNPIPVAAFAPPVSVCARNSVSFNDLSTVSSGSIQSWTWSLGNSVTSTVQSPTLTYNNPGVYSIQLIVQSDAGCRDTMNQSLTIWAEPQAAFSNTEACDGIPIQFTNNSSIIDATPLLFAWDLGDNTTSAANSPLHLYPSQGTYTANLLVTSQNGCTSVVSRAVNVHAIPDAAFSTQSICEDASANFTDLSVIAAGQIANWFWTFGDGNTGVLPSPSHVYNDPGDYNIKLVITSNFGCQDSTVGLIRIIPKPQVDFLTENVCFGFPIQLTSLATPVTGVIDQYAWSFGDGSSATDEHPVHLYNSPGWYSVSLTATTDSGCVTTLTRPNAVHIYNPPDAIFATNSSEASDIYPLINFTNLTTSPGFTYWDFGDGNTSTEYSPAHMYADIGLYDVLMVTVDYNGCIDSTLSRVEIRPSSTVYIPNGFTPNGDTKNDLFRVYSYNVVKLAGQIFDRWGLKIYEWDSLEGGWDGKINGNPAQSDVYVYRVETVDVNNKKEILIGHLSLVR